MNHREKLRRACVWPVAAAGLMVAVSVGCQEQVVRREFGPPPVWTNQGVEYHPASPAESTEEDDFFEDVGEALFGWMDGDDQVEPDPAPSRTPRYEPIWSGYE